jgi:hypothetical protein
MPPFDLGHDFENTVKTYNQKANASCKEHSNRFFIFLESFVGILQLTIDKYLNLIKSGVFWKIRKPIDIGGMNKIPI